MRNSDDAAMSTVLYDQIGIGYSWHRQTDVRIAAQIARVLGLPRSVLNVGAGTGSYEPPECFVVAVETSAEMLRQRPADAGPATYLNVAAHGAISTFAKLTDPRPGLKRLEKDLANGTWEELYRELLTLSELDIGYRLVVHDR